MPQPAESPHQLSMGFGYDQALITVTSQSAEFTTEDERIPRILDCLMRHKIHANMYWFEEQKLMICVDRRGERIDQAGKDLRPELEYSSDAGFTFMRIGNYKPELAFLLPEGEEEIYRQQNGDEICVVVRLPKEERVRRRKRELDETL